MYQLEGDINLLKPDITVKLFHIEVDIANFNLNLMTLPVLTGQFTTVTEVY